MPATPASLNVSIELHPREVALVRSPRRGRPAGGGDPRVFEHLLDAPSRPPRARRERRAYAGLSVPFLAGQAQAASATDSISIATEFA